MGSTFSDRGRVWLAAARIVRVALRTRGSVIAAPERATWTTGTTGRLGRLGAAVPVFTHYYSPFAAPRHASLGPN